jgi:hypothetical protein
MAKRSEFPRRRPTAEHETFYEVMRRQGISRRSS